MYYVLIAVAAFMSIITTFILNNLNKSDKNRLRAKIAVVAISIALFIIIVIYILQGKNIF